MAQKYDQYGNPTGQYTNNPYGTSPDYYEPEQPTQSQQQQNETTTGGYITGVGETLGAGSSMTASNRDRYLAEARAAGVPDSFINDFLSRNPGDYNRLVSSYNSGQTGSGQDTNSSSNASQGQSSVSNSSNTPSYDMSATNDLIRQMLQRQSDQDAQNRARGDQLYNMLLSRANQATSINANDPIIKGQVDAFRNEGTRAQRDYLADLAEKSGPYANLLGEQRLASETLGQNVGNFQAQLLGNELTARRQEISDALNSMGSLLTASEQNELQRQLGILDNAISQQNIGLGQQGINNDLFRILSQNDQFAAQLGLNAQDRASYWDSVRRGLL